MLHPKDREGAPTGEEQFQMQIKGEPNYIENAYSPEKSKFYRSYNTAKSSPIRNDKTLTVFGKPNMITVDTGKFPVTAPRTIDVDDLVKKSKKTSEACPQIKFYLKQISKESHCSSWA